jgi:hypothetical protein
MRTHTHAHRRETTRGAWRARISQPLPHPHMQESACSLPRCCCAYLESGGRREDPDGYSGGHQSCKQPHGDHDAHHSRHACKGEGEQGAQDDAGEGQGSPTTQGPTTALRQQIVHHVGGLGVPVWWCGGGGGGVSQQGVDGWAGGWCMRRDGGQKRGGARLGRVRRQGGRAACQPHTPVMGARRVCECVRAPALTTADGAGGC